MPANQRLVIQKRCSQYGHRFGRSPVAECDGHVPHQPASLCPLDRRTFEPGGELRLRHHGLLAPNAGLRERVTALATGAEPDAPPRGRSGDDAPTTPAQTAARSRWARLISRIYDDSPLNCPDCGAGMRILAFLTDAFTVVGILRHLGPPHTAPPLTPASAPPRGNPAPGADPFLDLDQTPAFDPTEPDPIPDFDFDQTRSG